MTTNFPQFAQLVAKGFQALAATNHVYVVGVGGDALYERYLAAFPAGTNPIFRKRTEYDCSSCKQFIRRAGNVVTVETGKVHTVWDEAAALAPYPFNVVAMRLRNALLGEPILDLFRVSEKETGFGAAQTRSLEGETVHTWNHLYTGEIPKGLRVASPDQVRGDYRTTVQVFERGLRELTPEAVETALSLIEANSLYRGEEHKPALLQFQIVQQEFIQLSDRTGGDLLLARNLFAWTHAHGLAARFRNTVIGTLVQDLSEGRDLDQAVSSFEAKVAPQNYKRTTALITPGMVKKAMETIQELGLESALERRFARLSDISVNDVKWVDGAVKPLMKGGIGDVLMKHAVEVKRVEQDESRAELIGLDDFMERVLPNATSLELLLRGEHLSNLMVLTAPVHSESKQLFRWNNDFAWSYGGNVTDSIKERVKKAGGKVEGAVLRVSLSWFNYDDLDLHIYEPLAFSEMGLSGHIYFRHKRGYTGGVLDVDMNAGYGRTREPVENVVWMARMPDGPYRIEVNNFSQRETIDGGFVIEVENGGKLSHYSYNKAVRDTHAVSVATLYMNDGVVDHVLIGDPNIVQSNISQEKWGLRTETYIKVSAVTLSPNYWGANKVGNKHTFFVLDGCVCDEPMRGIYNEFLHPWLEPHRKVFEVVGEKTKCQPTEDQIAGVGFSSTKQASFLLKVQQGKKQRLFNVKVGQ
jgi:hypothetical protein